MTANKKSVSILHELLARDLKDRLENGEVFLTKDGETVLNPETGEKVRVRPSPATLNVVRQFLKDNGIDAEARQGTPFGEFVKTALPFAIVDAEEAH